MGINKMTKYLPLTTMVLFAVAISFPEYLVTMPVFSILYKTVYYGYLLLMLLDFLLLKKKRNHLKKEPVWVAAYFGVLLFSTLLFKGFDIQLIKSLIKTAIITVLVINFLVKYK